MSDPPTDSQPAPSSSPALVEDDQSTVLQAADRYQIFEQVALERLRSGSDQSKPVSFLPLPVRLTAIAAMAITGLGVLWAVLARVPVQVNAIGAIVPEGPVSSAQARVDGVLQYQVSGVGPDLLSPRYRQRNEALSQFWDKVVIQTNPTLPSQQVLQLVNDAQLPAIGQKMLMPELLDGAQRFDETARGNTWQRQLFLPGNQLVAMIDSPQAVEELDSVRRLFKTKLTLDQQTSRDRRQRAVAYGSVDGLIAQQLLDKREELTVRMALLQRLEGLRSKGYVSEVQLMQEQAAVNNLKQQILQLDRERIGNDFTGIDQKQQADQSDLSALQSTDQLQDALVTFLSKAFVISPPGGIYVIAKYIQSGVAVHVGDELFTYSIRPPALPSRIPVFVDTVVLQQLDEGMTVLVTPKGISRAQYGGIEGVVDEVGRLPLTGEALASVAGGRSLASAIAQVVANPYLVRVKLKVADPASCRQLLSRRCYAWSSNRLPPFPVRMGTQADVQITTLYRRPIDFVMPALRQALGLVVDNR